MRANIVKKIVANVLALLTFFVFISVDAIADESRGIDVLIVMDNSGSMVKNDRSNLRFQVVKNFIHWLNLGDSIGVMTFDTETQMQLPITEIKNQDDRRFLVEQIVPSLTNKDTDVYAALLAAFKEMKSNVLSNNIKFFILVTDGVIDPSPEFRVNDEVRDKYYEELDLLIKEYEDNIWPIFVVFLNPKGIEDDYLKGIAQRTGGSFYNLENANQFDDIFSQILDRIGTIKGDIEKVIEDKELEKARHLPEIKVDVMSPNIEGKYYYNEKVNIEAQILGNNRKLIEDHSTIIDSFIVEILDPNKNIHVEELNDQGDLGDVKKGDGIYSISFIPEEIGRYEFYFKVIGKYNGLPFVSEGYSDIEILSPIIINIAFDEKNTGILEVMQGKKLDVYLNFEANLDSKQIIEFTSSPKSEISIKPIRVAVLPGYTQNGILRLPIPRDIPAGEHKILLSVNTFGQGVKVEPGEIALKIRVIPYEFLVSNALAIYAMLIAALIGFLLVGFLILLKHRERIMVKKETAGDIGRDVLEKFRIEDHIEH